MNQFVSFGVVIALKESRYEISFQWIDSLRSTLPLGCYVGDGIASQLQLLLFPIVNTIIMCRRYTNVNTCI